MTAEGKEICRRALATVVGRYGWRGAWDEEEFLQEIVAEWQARIPQVRGKSTPQVLEDAATFCYCCRWYRACNQNGTVAQHEAIESLRQWIYRSVFYRVRGDEQVAQEIAQQVIISIWRSLGSVREPGYFLSFVRQATMRQIPKTVKALRKEREEELVDQIPDEQSKEELVDQIPDEQSNEEIKDESEDLLKLEDLIRRCLPSKDRQTVILEHILSGKPISDIAKLLGKKAGAVSTLKSRSIDQLRRCPEMMQWRNSYSGQSSAGSGNLSKSVAYLMAVLDETSGGMTCEACRSWLPVYVEEEVSGYNVAQRHPEVRFHLDICAECEQEYIELLDSTLQEREVDLPDVIAPPGDLSFLPPLSFQELLRWLLQGVIQQRRPARLPDLQTQMEALLRQFTALLSSPVPSAVGVLGPDQTYERLNLATYDVARSLLQAAQSLSLSEPSALESWVQREAARAARHQKLSEAESEAFVAAITQLVCRNPDLLQRVGQ